MDLFLIWVWIQVDCHIAFAQQTNMSTQKEEESELERTNRLRKSTLTLPLQRELIEEIVSLGGIYSFNSAKLFKPGGPFTNNAKTELGTAVLNKVNYCKRQPAHYETIQNQIFGRIIDNSSLPEAAGSPLPHKAPRPKATSRSPPRKKVSSSPTCPEQTPTSTTPQTDIKAPSSATKKKVREFPASQVQSPGRTPRTPSSTKKKIRSSSLLACQLASSFSTMSLEKQFGTTPTPHSSEEVEPKTGFMDGNFMIFRTSDVICGDPQSITSTITFVLSNIDPRWLSKMPKGFMPFQVTQTSKNTVVFENPIAHYDFFFSPRMNKTTNAFNKYDLEAAFVISENDREQIEYERMRKNILDIKQADLNESWRTRTEFIFPGVVLDYTHLDSKRKFGSVKQEFVMGPTCTMKWVIAVEPKADGYIHADSDEEEEDIEKEYKAFMAQRLQKLEKVKNEGSGGGAFSA